MNKSTSLLDMLGETAGEMETEEEAGLESPPTLSKQDAGGVAILEPKESVWSWFPNLWWNRSPAHLLQSIEETIFSRIRSKTSGFYVEFDGDFFEADGGGTCRIWTRKTECLGETSSSSPIVLVHGMGIGQASFAMNLDGLAERSTVFSVDLPGFCRSSRNRFSTDLATCEVQHVEALERWRSSLGIDKMNLCGHSFGGYVVTLYALRHPDRVNHLILADPWGFLDKPPDFPNNRGTLFKLVVRFSLMFNPLAALRFCGRIAPSLVRRVRGDLVTNFSNLWENREDNLIIDYIVHSNLHNPTGEMAFRTLMDHYVTAKNPLIHRICNMDPELPLTAIYGGRSWIKYISSWEFKEARGGRGYSHSTKIDDAPHHVYVRVRDFNRHVLSACKATTS